VLIFFKETPREKVRVSIAKEARTLWKKTRGLLAFSGVGLFLGAYFLFNDALQTAINNFPIFLDQIWHISDTIKTYILLGIFVTSAIGGIAAGAVADKFGHKRTLVWITAGWVVIFPLIGFLTNFTLFIIATTLMGIWYGASWAVARSVMAYIAPKDQENLAFAYYGLAERASSFIGPLVWGGVVSGFVYLGDLRYRLAVLAITLFIVIGFFVLMRVRDDKSA
jgi:UMF1 family MFS transporter